MPVMIDPTVKCCTDVLTPMQIKSIRDLGDALIATAPLEAEVGYNADRRVIERVRKAVVQWLPFPAQDPRTQWIYDMAADVVQQCNGLYWRFDLREFTDQLHYVRYTAPSDHFSWHRDSGDDWQRPQRKLSFSLMLSDPEEYSGGELQVLDQTVKERGAGTFAIFPSSMRHRVLPVTRGERRALIGWASGPPLR